MHGHTHISQPHLPTLTDTVTLIQPHLQSVLHSHLLTLLFTQPHFGMLSCSHSHVCTQSRSHSHICTQSLLEQPHLHSVILVQSHLHTVTLMQCAVQYVVDCCLLKFEVEAAEQDGSWLFQTCKFYSNAALLPLCCQVALDRKSSAIFFIVSDRFARRATSQPVSWGDVRLGTNWKSTQDDVRAAMYVIHGTVHNFHAHCEQQFAFEFLQPLEAEPLGGQGGGHQRTSRHGRGKSYVHPDCQQSGQEWRVDSRRHR